MVTKTIPYAEVGMASLDTESYVTVELLSGEWPQYGTLGNYDVVADLVIPAFSVVGLDAGNKIVMAKTSATAVKPIGITTAACFDVDGAQKVNVVRGGCFNPAALNWHADYDTDAKKAAAFEDAASPTQIVIRPIG